MSLKEKALIIGVNLNNQSNFTESMEELKNLAEACEFEVVGKAEQNLKTINPAYYIGQGKTEELKIQLSMFLTSLILLLSQFLLLKITMYLFQQRKRSVLQN